MEKENKQKFLLQYMYMIINWQIFLNILEKLYTKICIVII